MDEQDKKPSKAALQNAKRREKKREAKAAAATSEGDKAVQSPEVASAGDLKVTAPAATTSNPTESTLIDNDPKTTSDATKTPSASSSPKSPSKNLSQGNNGGSGAKGKGIADPTDTDVSEDEEEPTAKDLAMNELKLKADQLRGREVSEDDLEMPYRPLGTPQGTAVPVLTNHYAIDTSKIETLHTYTVKIKKVLKAKDKGGDQAFVDSGKQASSNKKNSEIGPSSRRMWRRIMFLLLQQTNFPVTVGTDYYQSLVSLNMLAPHKASVTHTVDYYGEGEQGPRPAPHQTQYQVTLDYNKQLSVKGLRDFINASKPTSDFKAEEVVAALNLVLARRPNQNSAVLNISHNSFFRVDTPATARQTLGSALEAYVGYFRSVRLTKRQVLVNVNSTASAFYKEIPLNDLLREFTGVSTDVGVRPTYALERFIRGIRVQATHGTQRVYTVFGFAEWSSTNLPTASRVTFDKKVTAANGSEVMTTCTIKEYIDRSKSPFARA